jgi:hypothetical protein
MTGGLISFLFYFLVVYIPESRKRRMIKANLRKWYSVLKKDILIQVLIASQKGGRGDLSTDGATVERLSRIDGFKAAFKGGREAHEGFYAFRNYMSEDTPEYREISLSFQILSRQIEYVLHHYSIDERELFDFFKRLEAHLLRLEKIGPGYHEEQELSRFIWEIFAGSCWVDGYRGYDIVEKMIEDI